MIDNFSKFCIVNNHGIEPHWAAMWFLLKLSIYSSSWISRLIKIAWNFIYLYSCAPTCTVFLMIFFISLAVLKLTCSKNCWFFPVMSLQSRENVLKILRFYGLEIMFHIQRGHLASHHGVPCRGIQMIVEKEHFFSAMFTDDMWNLIVIIYKGIVNLPGIKM